VEKHSKALYAALWLWLLLQLLLSAALGNCKALLSQLHR